ncbi:MAG TPA: DEAD/DEAH box helicase [Gemmatimonadales bacterium]|nr:DEAD/DEAH box helicase [Gemmatimonadales bacterium]
MHPQRDHFLPPDLEAYRRAEHPRGRVIVIAPTRAACETIELALQTRHETLLERQHGATLIAWARAGKRFGIVAGTGTGKTLATRFIAEAILEAPLRVGVVNREREATAETALCNTLVITTGIARRWLTDDLVTARDTVVVDEIHQTSAELELCLALGKRAGCRFIWLSATVDPVFYRAYLESDEVLETSAFDPALRAKVTVTPKQPDEFLDDRTVRRFVAEKRGVAVFLPTRAEVERLGEGLGARFPKLDAAFYHGGEPIRIIRPYLEGEVKKPWLLAMTAAGQSALNVPGLDTVIIYDARYANVIERGRNVLHRLHLGANEILQMAGRVHGRVKGGEVVILSDRDLDFGSLRPVPPEFQLAGDTERVALTCAALGVDATDLELPVPLDRVAYARALQRLTERGLIEDGKLTRYGREVEALPVERPWAELLVHADDDLLPLVAGASGFDSLHRMTREERDLHGVQVPGSDHLTAYNLLAEAVNQCGRLDVVHGMPRHVFDEVELAAWAERRGVLMKAIEDGALGMASAYRALDLTLPRTLPYADRERRAAFTDLVARIQPFDFVLDERTIDGQEARIGKTSVAGSWGGVAGSVRYFADRFGVPRASVEGTTIPYELVQRYAMPGPPEVVFAGHRQRQGLALARRMAYFGFPLETTLERLEGEIPPAFREAAHRLLARGLLTGEAEHPMRGRIVRAVAQLREYWKRSGGALAAATDDAILALLEAQLGDVTSWQAFLATPVAIDVDAIVPADERAHLDALPTSLRVHGDVAPLEYAVERGEGVVRLLLREGQARRLQPDDVPPFDRPVRFCVRRGDEMLEAPTVAALQVLLRQPRTNRVRGGRRHDDDRGSRGGRGGRGGPPGSRGGGGRGGGPRGRGGGPRGRGRR